jgi:hypothetical protein
MDQRYDDDGDDYDMVSVTASLGHDLTVALITLLTNQCTPDNELFSATIGPIPHLTILIYLTHDISQKTHYIIYITTYKGQIN